MLRTMTEDEGVRKAMTQSSTAADLQFAMDRLAKFKCPERIEVLDAFPVTRVGKLDRPALKRLVADKVAQEAALTTAQAMS